MEHLPIGHNKRIANLNRWQQRRAVVDEIYRVTLWVMNAIKKGFPPAVQDTIIQGASVGVPPDEFRIHLIPDAITYAGVYYRVEKVPSLEDRRALIRYQEPSEIASGERKLP